MTTLTAKSSFDIEHWDEKNQVDWKNGKLSRTVARKKFIGELEGTGLIEATMLRLEGEQEGTMAYIGIEHINCTIKDRKGSFILVHNAAAHGTNRTSVLQILQGSGTGDFIGISGTGEISPGHDFTLTYEINSETA